MKNKIHSFYGFPQSIFFKIFSVLAIIIAIFSLRYMLLGPEGINYLKDNDNLLSFLSQSKSNFWQNYIISQKPLFFEHEFALLAHIIGASIALITGVFQLMPTIFNNRLNLHKIIGSLYTVSSLIGLSFGAYISYALPMIGGLGSIIMNIIIGLLGIIFILLGLLYFWQKKYSLHGKWMFRSYGIISTILTLYILIGIFAICKLSDETGYELAHLTCLPINLCIVELIIWKKSPNKKS